VRGVHVASPDVSASDDRQQESPFRTVAGLSVEEVLRPRDPAGGSGRFTSGQQIEHQPEGAACRTLRIVQPQPFGVCTRPHVGADLVLAEHVRRDRQALEIARTHLRAGVVGRRQSRVRLFPVLPRECVPSRRKPVGDHVRLSIFSLDRSRRKPSLRQTGTTSNVHVMSPLIGAGGFGSPGVT
jgi:hypothetical protein